MRLSIVLVISSVNARRWGTELVDIDINKLHGPVQSQSTGIRISTRNFRSWGRNVRSDLSG